MMSDYKHSEWSYFFDSKKVNVKLMNGDMFFIEINDFDTDESILDKICSYNEEYRLRKHRIKIFKDYNEDCIQKDIWMTLEDNDTIYIFSESPVVERKIETLLAYNWCNYFFINSIECCLDAMDAIYFNFYDKDIPVMIDIDQSFTLLECVQLNNLIKTVMEKEDIKYFSLKSRNCLSYEFIDVLVNNYREMNTIVLDFRTSRLNNNYNKIFDKISTIPTENVYLSTSSICNSHNIKFDNTSNVYIFYGNHIEGIDNCDFILNKFSSINHNIIIDYKYMRIDENKKYPNKMYKNGWIHNGKDALDQNISIYKHITKTNDYELFNIDTYKFFGDCEDDIIDITHIEDI